MNVSDIIFKIMIFPHTGCSLPEAQKIAEDSIRYFSLPSRADERQKHDLAKGEQSILPRTVMRTHSMCIYLLQSKGEIKLLGRGSQAKVGKVLVIDQQGLVQLKKGRIVFAKPNSINPINEIESPYLDVLSGPYTYTSEKKNQPRSLYFGELLLHNLSHPMWKHLSLLQTLSILENVASGLATLHALGFVHNDIKPDNILIRFNSQHFDSKRLEGVIADFGLLVAENTKVICGTAHWVSPETTKKVYPTRAKDIWALGLVVYYLLSVNKKLPEFIPKKADEREILKKLHLISNSEITHEKVFPKGWSKFPVIERVESLIIGCFSLDPSARPDAEKFAKELREIIADIQLAESVDMIMDASEKL